MEPLQLPEQSGQVQGRRGKARVHPQGVPLVLYDVTHPPGGWGGAQEPFGEAASCHVVVVWVNVVLIRFSMLSSLPVEYQERAA